MKQQFRIEVYNTWKQVDVLRIWAESVEQALELARAIHPKEPYMYAEEVIEA